MRRLLLLLTSTLLTAINAKKSFYILFANQIDAPAFPQQICQNAGLGPQGKECVDGTLYDIFIISPQNITKEHLTKVRTLVPSSRVVAYWDFNHMPLLPSDPLLCPFCHGHTMGDRLGRNCKRVPFFLFYSLLEPHANI